MIRMTLYITVQYHFECSLPWLLVQSLVQNLPSLPGSLQHLQSYRGSFYEAVIGSSGLDENLLFLQHRSLVRLSDVS